MKQIQRVALTITDPAVDTPNQNSFTVDFVRQAKKLIGINIKSGISGNSLVDVKTLGKTIVDTVPVDAFMCNEDYVAPDQRFNTLFPDPGNIKDEEISIDIDDDGTGSYPYTATVLLLLDVDD